MSQSPPPKKNALGTISEVFEEESPLTHLVDKIPNADVRKDLTIFLCDNEREKPQNVPCSVWNIIRGLTEIISMVVENNFSSNSSANVEAVDERTTNGGSNWSEVVSRGERKRKQVKTRNSNSPVPALNLASGDYLSAVREQERLRSAVLCHISESTAITPREKEIEDEEKVRSLIYNIDETLKIDRFYRMGSLAPGKNRLIKIVFCTSQMQRTALINAKKLRTIPGGKGVFLRASMTKEQLQDFTAKRKKLHYLRSLDPNWVIYRDDFWLKHEIGKQTPKTLAPAVPQDDIEMVPNAQSSRDSTQNQGN